MVLYSLEQLKAVSISSTQERTAHQFNKTLAELIATKRYSVFLSSQIAPLWNNHILTVYYTVNVQSQLMAKPLLLQ